MATCGHFILPDRFDTRGGWCAACGQYALLGRPGTQKALLRNREGFTKLLGFPGLYPPLVIVIYRMSAAGVSALRHTDPNPEGALVAIPFEAVEFHYTGKRKARLWFYEER